jgi:hypothetical protein
LRSQEGKFWQSILREVGYDFDKASRICRSLTPSRKLALSLIPEVEKEEEELKNKQKEGRAKMDEWLNKQRQS